MFCEIFFLAADGGYREHGEKCRRNDKLFHSCILFVFFYNSFSTYKSLCPRFGYLLTPIFNIFYDILGVQGYFLGILRRNRRYMIAAADRW